MRTDDLIAMLAQRAEPVEPGAVRRRFALGLGSGLLATALLVALILGVRPDLIEATQLPMFWVKLVFPAALALTALHLARRLGRPGIRPGAAPRVIAALVASVWLLGLLTLLDASPDVRKELIFGDTWVFCLISIPLLSVPVFAATIWAMKGLAPTRLRMAGAAAGLLAGAAAAAVYALHCPEVQAPFVATWYVLGMLIPAAAGALLGPRLLRW